jgi:hypothetical protein
MIVIAEIFVFSSPFEPQESTLLKIRKLRSGLGDFCTSILGVDDCEFDWRRDSQITVNIPHYQIQYTRRDDSLAEIHPLSPNKEISETKNFLSFDPLISLKISVTPGHFDAQILGAILSEISHIFKGNFHSHYFVEVASEYPLAQYARGQELSLEKLEQFDLDRPNSSKNKIILDHLLYLRYSLHKNILASLRLRKDIDNAKEGAILPLDGSSNLALFAGRMSSIEKSLYARMLDIEKLITHFISFL